MEEEDKAGSSEGGAYLICVGELTQEKAARKKEKEITVGILVNFNIS